MRAVTDAAALLRAYDDQARPAEWTELEPGSTAHRDGPIHRVVGQSRRGFVSGPSDLGVTGVELDELIARQRDFFAARGEAVEWKTWSHDVQQDLPQRLEAAGFVADERETVLVGLAEDMTAPVVLDGITVRETRAEADMRALADVNTEVWGDDYSWIGEKLIAAKDDPNIIVAVAEADGRVISSGRLEIVRGTEFGGLWGGATLAAYRGRGTYRALVALRAQRAVERGVKYLQVDASEDSRPILERLGFVAVTTTTPYIWTP